MPYSILVYSVTIASMAAYVVVALIPYLLVLLLPRRPREFFLHWITVGLGYSVVTGLRAFARVRFQNCSGDALKPGIYVFNHRAATDAFLMALLNREAIQIVNGWPMKLPFFGFNARLNGYVDATRIESMESLVESSREKLSRGVSIIAFPEGTRSGSRRMHTFHSGVFRLAQALKVPLYPCCIAGNESFPDRSFRFHPTRVVVVRVLPPVMPEEAATFPSAFVFKTRVHNRIEEETKLLDGMIDHGEI